MPTENDSLRGPAAATGAGHAHDGLIAEIEDLLARVSRVDDPRFTDLRQRLQSSLRRTRDSALDAAGTLRERATAAGESADLYARDRPWTLAGIAILVGVAVGALMSRR